MRIRTILLLTVISFMLLDLGCGPKLKPWQKAEKSFKVGDIQGAEQILLPMETKVKDNNYPLNLLSLGSIELTFGDYRKAQMYFNTALANMDVEISGGEVTKQVFKSETGRLYRERFVPKQGLDLQARQAKKTAHAQAVPKPAAQAPIPKPPEAKPQTREQIIQEMRKQRGQLPKEL